MLSTELLRIDRQIKWLQTAANIFDLMYTNSDDDSKFSKGFCEVMRVSAAEREL